MTGGIESRQVIGVVTEISIHLEDVLVVSLQSPLKACDIGRAQSQLALALNDENPVAELSSHHPPDDGGCAVGGPVVDDKDMETLVQGEYRTDNLFDILLFVIRWDDNYTVAFVHLYNAFLVQRYE